MKWDDGTKEGNGVGAVAKWCEFFGKRRAPTLVEQCSWCGRDLYEGDDVFELPDGAVLCRNKSCVREYVDVATVLPYAARPEVTLTCDVCGREFGKDDEAYALSDGALLCWDDACLFKHIGAFPATIYTDDGSRLWEGDW